MQRTLDDGEQDGGYARVSVGRWETIRGEGQSGGCHDGIIAQMAQIQTLPHALEGRQSRVRLKASYRRSVRKPQPVVVSRIGKLFVIEAFPAGVANADPAHPTPARPSVRIASGWQHLAVADCFIMFHRIS